MFSCTVIALLAPGQGSQTPGMFGPWLELDGAEQRVTSWSKATGLDLVRLGTTAEAEEIKDTSITQPLVVALALLAFEELRKRVDLPADTIVAGHSVGELAAAAMAGVLSADDAVALAAVRGAEMAAACALHPTGMAAVLGGDEQDVLATLDVRGLTAANMNGGGQIVAAGPIGAIQLLAEKPPEGSRVIPLQVAGAFHTKYMASAVDRLHAAAAALTPSDPALPIWTNKDGSRVESGRAFLDLIVGQVANPVRWDLVMASLGGAGVTGIIELAPAGALVGLVKRGLKGVPTIAVKTPDDLAAARLLLGGAA